MKLRITDKKLNDKRFRETEKAILKAFFGEKLFLNARILAKRAKISHSTLYRHHKTVYEIVPDYEKYILEKYCRLMRGLVNKKGIKMRTVYWQMLIFILKNRIVFELISDRGDGRLIEKMVQKLEPKVIVVYKLPKNHNMMLGVYRKEVAGLIEDWIRQGVQENRIEIVLGDIMYMTNTMRQRLKILEG